MSASHPVDNGDSLPVSVQDVERILQSHASPFPDTEVELDDAEGCILREDITADRDLPPFDRVTMDGIAVRLSDWSNGARGFAIAGMQPAGAPPQALDTPGNCLQVMTGAVMPRGADCVIPREYVTVRDGQALVNDDAPTGSMQFVHRQGVDARQGDVVVPRGTRLRSPQVLIAASVGKTRVRIASTPSFAVVSNGDELVPIEDQPQPHQVRASNSHALRAGLRETGVRDTHLVHYPDDRDAMVEGVRELLSRFDALVFSGGVSVGEFDYMPEVLETLNVRKCFHRVRQRPGKPFWFGVSPNGQPVFALPGNPVSALACFHRFIRPWLMLGMSGSWPTPPTVVLSEDVTFKSPLTCFLQVTVQPSESGGLNATPAHHHGSGDYASLGTTDGFVELEAGAKVFPAGQRVPYYPW